MGGQLQIPRKIEPAPPTVLSLALFLPHPNEVVHRSLDSFKMSSTVTSVARADAGGGFPASALATLNVPVIASVPANQPICDALLAEAAKRENPYKARAYRNAAVKVAGTNRNLFTDSPDGVEDAWLQHHLGEKTGLFVSEMVVTARLTNAYDAGRNPYALFPPEWDALLEDDARINVAIKVLTDMIDRPKEARRKFQESPHKSTYTVAYQFYSKYDGYDTDAILVWFYNNIIGMVMGG